MYPIQEQFKSDALAQLNSGVAQAGQIVGSFLEISREIGVLNVRTGKASAEAVTSAVQKLLAASGPLEFFQAAASVMRPDLQVWNAYTEQLRGIAGKLALPPAAAPQAARPLVSMVDAAPLDLQGVVPPAVSSEPAAPVEPPVLAEAVEEVEPVEQATQAAAASVSEPAAPAPEVPQAVQEVKQAIEKVVRATPVMAAAAAPAPQSSSKPALVPKAAVAKVARKPVPPARKNAPPARTSGRAKKA
jgi:hypothetical protein